MSLPNEEYVLKINADSVEEAEEQALDIDAEFYVKQVYRDPDYPQYLDRFCVVMSPTE